MKIRRTRMIDARIQLSKGRKRGRSHPDDERLVQVAVVVHVAFVQLVDMLVAPVRRIRVVLERLLQRRAERIAKFRAFVGRPGDAGLQQVDQTFAGGQQRTTIVHLVQLVDAKGVVEHRVRDRTTRGNRYLVSVHRLVGIRFAVLRDRLRAVHLRIVTRLHVPTMVLKVVAQRVVDVDIPRKVLGQRELDLADAASAGVPGDYAGTRCVRVRRCAVSVVDDLLLYLEKFGQNENWQSKSHYDILVDLRVSRKFENFETYLIRRQEQTDADRYERDSDEEEQRQNCVGGQDGLPCR